MPFSRTVESALILGGPTTLEKELDNSLEHNNIVVLMLPPIDEASGYLPFGIHDGTWEEFAMRFGFNPYRQKLMEGLLAALRNLRDAGCKSALIDGSFVSRKAVPG